MMSITGQKRPMPAAVPVPVPARVPAAVPVPVPMPANAQSTGATARKPIATQAQRPQKKMKVEHLKDGGNQQREEAEEEDDGKGEVDDMSPIEMSRMLRTLARKVETLEDSYGTLNESHETLKGSIMMLKEKIDTLEASHDTLQASHDTLEAKIERHHRQRQEDMYMGVTASTSAPSPSPAITSKIGCFTCGATGHRSDECTVTDPTAEQRARSKELIDAYRTKRNNGGLKGSHRKRKSGQTGTKDHPQCSGVRSPAAAPAPARN
eukprot:TRINITY_DN1508_c0_g1_i1.p2 TRINITY_DN1508_c0_g1~~TRINITY_DN1508_c0_g1_i1.p2  ORF type:complete len:265 (+),score=39.15 TRINITY_DN1508_c0_g1_i1:74-868(+)